MQRLQHDFELLAAFRYSLRRFLRFSEQAAAEVGLTPQQHQALLAIEGFPGRNSITITELAERLQLEHHSTIGIINRLARAKLVIRERSGKDKRCVLVRLSRKGRALLVRLTAAHKEQLTNLGPELLESLRALSAQA